MCDDFDEIGVGKAGFFSDPPGRAGPARPEKGGQARAGNAGRPSSKKAGRPRSKKAGRLGSKDGPGRAGPIFFVVLLKNLQKVTFSNKKSVFSTLLTLFSHEKFIKLVDIAKLF